MVMHIPSIINDHHPGLKLSAVEHGAWKKWFKKVEEDNYYSNDLPEIESKDYHLLFTYGTLRTGFGRNVVIKGSQCYGFGFTQDDTYHLRKTTYSKTKNWPACFQTKPDDERAGRVFGQIFRVSTPVLRTVDRVECNTVMFHRREVPIIITGGPNYGKVVSCWLYIANESIFRANSPNYTADMPFYVTSSTYGKYYQFTTSDEKPV